MAKKAPSTELTALELFAMLRAAKTADDFRDQLAPGTMGQVDFEVRIKGMVSVSPPQPRTELARPDTVGLFALVLDSLPTATRDKLEKALNTIYAKDLEDWPSASPEMRQVAEVAVSRWTRRQKKTQRGPITAMVTAEVLARH